MNKRILLILLLFGVSLTLEAQLPEEFLEETKYRLVGPTRGGRVTAITGIAEQPFTFWMGATGGGVWKTEDAGQNWTPMADGQIKAGSIGAIAVAPSNRHTLYVGTGSAAPRGNVSAGIGMYKSTDAGKAWTPIGLSEAGQIGDIMVHPQDENHLYVAALGHIFGKNQERGVYRSTDGGASWEAILQLNDSTGAVDLTMNPQNPKEMYAAFWRAERKPWTLIDGGSDGGIWKTMDGGDNWKKLSNGLPVGLVGRIGIDVSPANPQVVYAIIQAENEEEGGVYRSDNAGTSWKRVNRDHKLRQRGWYYSNITAHPTDEHTVYVSNVGFFRSIDGGQSFERVNTPHSDNHGVWINPEHPSIMINCNDGGANVSLNGGKSWSTQLNQPTSEFYRVTVDDQFPYRLYAGQQDNTTISVPSRNPGGVTPYEHWMAVGGGESADVAIDPNDPNRIWAGTYSGEITIMDRHTGHVRQVTAYPHYTEGTEMRNLKYRWQWNFPIIASQHEPRVVYHTSNFVHRTDNDGQTWTRISPDLTRNYDPYMGIPGGPIQHDATGVEVYATIFSFEESPTEPGTFWAGSDDGLLHITRDGGQKWIDITPAGLAREATINKIELSNHGPGRALVAAYNYRYDDFSPYLFLTTDYGASWKNIGKGLPEKVFIRTVAEDPVREGLIYAGTEYGMFISFDEGAHWQPFQQNLPFTPITDMEVHRNDLVLSTQGRSFWILDDLSVLQQIDDSVVAAERHLFVPEDSYRTNIRGYNPSINLYLKNGLEGDPVTIDIINKRGEIVRSLATDAKDERNKIRLKKGMNRISWDLQHEGPTVVDNLVTMVIGNPPSGPTAVPGRYTIRATHGEWQADVPLVVHPDPRWNHITEADYQAQLDLSLEIGQMITESHKRILNLRSIRQQIEVTAQLASRAGYGDELKELATDIAGKLTAVEDQLIQNQAESSQDNINYPRVFSNHIGRLYSVVSRGHHRPTDGVLERYADLQKAYAGIVEAYDQVMEQDLPLFNKMLEEKQVSRLIMPEIIK